jgi:TPR repeat protein
VPKGDAEAASWTRKAAEQGHAEAQLILGTLYETGNGVPQDLSRAMTWYRMAADNGNASAQALLGANENQAIGRMILAWRWLLTSP